MFFFSIRNIGSFIIRSSGVRTACSDFTRKDIYALRLKAIISIVLRFRHIFLTLFHEITRLFLFNPSFFFVVIIWDIIIWIIHVVHRHVLHLICHELHLIIFLLIHCIVLITSLMFLWWFETMVCTLLHALYLLISIIIKIIFIRRYIAVDAILRFEIMILLVLYFLHHTEVRKVFFARRWILQLIFILVKSDLLLSCVFFRLLLLGTTSIERYGVLFSWKCEWCECIVVII